MRTIEPSTADEVAAALTEATTRGERVVVRGHGTKAGWTSANGDADVLMLTRRLDRLVAHRHGDLTATVEAGATLDAVNRELRRNNQWIPLDPPWSDRATIGGIIGANDAGPRRHRYGSPRDLIIGVEIVRTDGVRAKAGGIVVKNVAGYDLARLMVGSFGCLAVVVSATFKLYPLAAASATVVADLPSNAAAGALVNAVNRSQLTPTAVEIQTPPLRVLIRFESIPASVEQQCARSAQMINESGGRATILRDADEHSAWGAHGQRPWEGAGAIAKLAILPAELAATLDAIGAASGGHPFELIGRAGLGVFLLRLEGDAASQARIVKTLRERTSGGRGAVTLLRAGADLKAAAGVWGPIGDAFRVMQSVKRAFDPRGMLNPGGGPGGL